MSSSHSYLIKYEFF
jgi:hypothetical protein